MSSILDRLRGGLIVSCQPVDNGPLDDPNIVSRFAESVLIGGASGLRIEGEENLRHVRTITDVPIVGLIKTDRPDTPIRITSTIADVDRLAHAGADIIAFDATSRTRPVSRRDIVNRIHQHKKLAMADCSNYADAQHAVDLGCEILGSTMSGYVGNETPTLPDLGLVKQLRNLNKFVVAEGRFNSPPLAQQAILAGADGVVVGSAITRPEHITSWFVQSVRAANSESGHR